MAVLSNVSITDLMSRSRRRADMENNNFITDAELVEYINSGMCELHDLLVQVYGQDYYVKSKEFTTAATVTEYPLNESTHANNIGITDFYKIRGVDAKLSGNEWWTIKPFNFNERNLFENWASWGASGLGNVRYRLVGDKLMLTPKPNGTTSIKIWYIPSAVQFSSSTDSTTSFYDINGYSEYVTTFAAIRMLQKEESDVSVLMAQKAELKRRIEEAASNRDAASPLSVSDVYSENNGFLWGFGPLG